MAGQITHRWEGTRLVITSDSGTSSCDLKGSQGDIGVRGPQGVAGIGVPGPAGVAGEPGPVGKTGASIVSTLLVGQDEQGGNIYEQIFDNGMTARFVAPRGIQGVQGEKGEKGDKGDKGESGGGTAAGSSGYWFSVSCEDSNTGYMGTINLPVEDWQTFNHPFVVNLVDSNGGGGIAQLSVLNSELIYLTTFSNGSIQSQPLEEWQVDFSLLDF